MSSNDYTSGAFYLGAQIWFPRFQSVRNETHNALQSFFRKSRAGFTDTSSLSLSSLGVIGPKIPIGPRALSSLFFFGMHAAVVQDSFTLLYKVRSLRKNDRHSDVTRFGCKNGSKFLKRSRRLWYIQFE